MQLIFDLILSCDVHRCTKPDRKEFSKIALATAVGFGIMGFIGFFVKLIHIPINNIIVGASKKKNGHSSKCARLSHADYDVGKFSDGVKSSFPPVCLTLLYNNIPTFLTKLLVSPN